MSSRYSSLSRTVFVRPRDGKHLLSPTQTLSILQQFSSRFGKLSHFHFPREPEGQRLLGYGSVTFLERQGARRALESAGGEDDVGVGAGGGGPSYHSVLLPPNLPSRPPRTYLDDFHHARLVGPAGYLSAKGMSYEASKIRWSGESFKNPVATRPGWDDVSATLGLEGCLEKYHWSLPSTRSDDTHSDKIYHLDPNPRQVEVKVEKRVSRIVSRPSRAKPSGGGGGGSKQSFHPRPSDESLLTALTRFDGFRGKLAGVRYDLERQVMQRRERKRDRGSNNRPPSSQVSGWTRNYSTTTTGLGRMEGWAITRRGMVTSASGGRSLDSPPPSPSEKSERKAEWKRNRKSQFVDSLTVRVTAGKGGDGCVSFHKEKYIPYGPPSGGNGGQGGSVYVRAVEGPTSLSRVGRRFRAKTGEHGQGSFLHGRKADDVYIQVPVGTVVTAVARLMDDDELEALEYEDELFRRAKKAKWDTKGMVAKPEVVERLEKRLQQDDQKRLARDEWNSKVAPSSKWGNDPEGRDEAFHQSEDEEVEQEQEDVDPETLLAPHEIQNLQSSRDKVWRHFPRTGEGNYRRDEFRAAEMRLALERRRARSTSRLSEERSAASQTPLVGSEGVGAIGDEVEQLWSVDLDRPTPADSPGYLVASGGAGGLGNPTFLTSTNRSPKFATRGTWGEAVELKLELKRPSDVGLVGLPNAGKSTILRALSAARAEVGHWRFTTLSPNLGVVRLGRRGGLMGVGKGSIQEGTGGGPTSSDGREEELEEESEESEEETFRLTVSDVPGLIEGASCNKGLGHSFLRHVERCSVLVYVIDIGPDNAEPWKDLVKLRNELEAYRPGLSSRARVV
ncbi:GTP-binding protein Obg/CgtA, partial [Violaceomyces palustris]